MAKGSSNHKKEKYKAYAAAKTAEKNKARRMIRDAKRSENWQEVLKKNVAHNGNADVKKFAQQFSGVSL
jgi:hypothetical protein